MRSFTQWIALLALLGLGMVHAHTVIVYPGYRGNNLHTNGTVQDIDGLGSAMVSNGSYVFPYGMQWMYPCMFMFPFPPPVRDNIPDSSIRKPPLTPVPGGGMPTSTNRTKWPINGGAVSFQPGWFRGHSTAFIYVNLGLGTTPENMSHPMISPFQITGPTNNPYPGTVCLPQLPLPANINVQVGDHATIQLIETAKHGAALYNVCPLSLCSETLVSIYVGSCIGGVLTKMM